MNVYFPGVNLCWYLANTGPKNESLVAFLASTTYNRGRRFTSRKWATAAGTNVRNNVPLAPLPNVYVLLNATRLFRKLRLEPLIGGDGENMSLPTKRKFTLLVEQCIL